VPRRRQERRCCRVSAPRGLAPPGIRAAPGRLVLHRGERKAEFAGHLAEGVFHVRVQQEQGHDPATAACVICCHRAQYTPKSDRTAAARILACYSGAETSSVLLPCVIGASGAEARYPPIWAPCWRDAPQLARTERSVLRGEDWIGQDGGFTDRSLSSQGAPNWVICRAECAATDGSSCAQIRRSRGGLTARPARCRP
jgi:hypothetical protein